MSLPGHAFRRFVFQRLARNAIGDGSVIERGCRLSSRGGIKIGNDCVINAGTLLDGRGGLEIGDRVNISPEVLLLTDEHDPDSPTFNDRPRPVEIGSRVWIGSRAIVLPGTIIGEGAVVGAGSVARGIVESDAIHVGVPARPIRSRAREAQSVLPTYRRFFH
ncbi:MAG: acyltransferase [Nocardiaceae bacterium]|nr:acyltransferase [Nocardiaceae bacterium]